MSKRMSASNLLQPTFSSWEDIYIILKELYIATFKWNNMPLEIDTRFLEEKLFDNGFVFFFYDEEVENYVTLSGLKIGLNIYNEPKEFRAIAPNGYNYQGKNGVDGIVIYNNNTKTVTQARLMQYAKRIYNLERTIDVNVQAQKTPFMIIVNNETQLLSMKKIMIQIDEFKPFILVDKMADVENNIKVIPTLAPFVADKLEEIKRKLWNEALSFIGIQNNSSEKNERLTADEVLISNGMAIANKNARLLARQRAVEKINIMFGLDIEVEIVNVMITESTLDSEVMEYE